MYSPERQYAEETAVVLEGMGLPRAYGKLLGWLLICDPPQQSSAELAEALDLSAGSVSSATRMLENGGLIRRAAAPGRRGEGYPKRGGAVIPAPPPEQVPPVPRLMGGGGAPIGGG